MARARSEQELWNISEYATKRILSGRGGEFSHMVGRKALAYAVRIERSESYQKSVTEYQIAHMRKSPDAEAIKQETMNRKYPSSYYMNITNY